MVKAGRIDWTSIDAQKARIAAHRAQTRNLREQARDELGKIWTVNGARPIEASMADHAICDLAQRRADVLTDRIIELAEPLTPEAMRLWLSAQIEAIDARPLADFTARTPIADQLAGMLARARCPLWWRRQLRRAVVTLRETEAMQRGEVCKRRRQPYCTNDTTARRAGRNAANAAMLEATELEDAAGQTITLAQAVAASTSNKAIRRGELMTRIRGCEEWANAAGMVGLFTTNTAPSRFHPQTMHNGPNPKHEGATARDAQAWLCATWAKARASIKRAGLGVFGFRVAEPHHDGCPHWHMLLWCKPEHLDALRATLRRYWLADEGTEPGAAEHRFKAITIDPAQGSAVAYIAKYIAKNIDDAGGKLAGHTDHQAGEQAELFGATAARVEAWAAAWGIRQFQAIGQPPVTVWRELRRITPESVAGASDTVKAAHQAAHRIGERRACWRGYLAAQGGAMQGRDYRVRIVADVENKEGRYGLAEVIRPRGVEDTFRAGVWVLSSRKEWRPRGTWRDAERVPDRTLRVVVRGGPAQPACPPRTRFNNCTRAGFAGVLRDLLERNGAARIDSKDMQTRAGGPHHRNERPPPCTNPGNP